MRIHPDTANVMQAKLVVLAGRVATLLVIVGVPLAFDVRAIWGTLPTELVLAPKAVVLTVAASLGIVYLMLSFPDVSFRNAPLRLMRAPMALRLSVALLFALTVGWLMSSDTPPILGFLGPENRYDGMFLFASALIGFFVAARLSFLSQGDARVAVGGLVVVSVLVTGFSVAEIHGVDVWARLGIHGVSASGGKATLGHASLVSILASVGAVAAVQVAARCARLGVVWLSGGLGVLLAWGVTVSGGRAAFVALVLVLLWSLGARVVHGRRVGIHVVVVHVLTLGALALGLLVSPSNGVTTDALSRVAMGTDRSWNSRLATYRVALKMLADQPITPYGVGAFRAVAWNYATEQEEMQMMSETVPVDALQTARRVGRSVLFIDPGTGRQYAVLTDYDKSHNYILDFALGFGILSAVLLVALVGTIFAQLARSNSDIARTMAYVLAVFALVAQAWFPTLAVDPPIWAALGVGLGSSLRKA